MATPSLEIKNASFKNEQKLFSLQNAYLNFTIFFLYWFAIGVDRVDGWKCIPEHQTDYCKRLQFKRKTSTQMPRFHLKSTVTEAFICWKLFRMERVWNEWDYMSFTQDLGEYHTKRLKRYIDAMPEVYQNHRSLSSAESIIYYELKDHSGPKKFLCEPSGILSFKRGRHPTGMICDDILKDPAVKLDLSQLIKIERAFVEEIENMPSEDLHLVGTPQDQEDLFHKKSKDPAFDSKIYTAESDPTNKKALWESNPKFNWVELMKKKKANPKMYMKEFMCMPVRSMDAYISLDQINDSIKSRLKNYSFARVKIKCCCNFIF